jgi:hypothetical protein
VYPHQPDIDPQLAAQVYRQLETLPVQKWSFWIGHVRKRMRKINYPDAISVHRN